MFFILYPFVMNYERLKKKFFFYIKKKDYCFCCEMSCKKGKLWKMEDAPRKQHLLCSTFTLCSQESRACQVECAMQYKQFSIIKPRVEYVWRIRVGFLVSFAPHESSSSLRFYFLRAPPLPPSSHS